MSARGDQLNWPFAALWASFTLALWLVSCSLAPRSPAWLAPLSVLTCGALTMAAVVRLPGWQSLPIPRGWTAAYWPEVTGPIDQQLCWLLAWTSQWYLLATAWQLSGTVLAALPGLFVALLIEVALWKHAPTNWQRVTEGGLLDRPDDDDRRLNASAEQSFGMAGSGTSDSDESLRSQSQGILLNGQTYQTGWVIVQLAAEQKQASITCVFSPPFLLPPEVELDCELIDEADSDSGMDVELETEHVTPAGVRVSIKRKQAARSARLKVMWHAIEGEDEVIRKLP